MSLIYNINKLCTRCLKQTEFSEKQIGGKEYSIKDLTTEYLCKECLINDSIHRYNIAKEKGDLDKEFPKILSI